MTKITIRVETESDDFYSERKAEEAVIKIDNVFAAELLSEALTDMVKRYQERKAKAREEE